MRRARDKRSARRAFTLLELLVAVGIAALLAVAVAGIFTAVGRTVSAGRRLSDLNVYVAMIEQVMRRDFEGLSREGFLVIRNEKTMNQDQERAVRLSEEDGRPRVRRVDEILFFAKGEFRSAREALDPQRVAEASAARIYYGHGRRRVDIEGPIEPGGTPLPGDVLRLPRLDDANVEAPATVGGLGAEPPASADYTNPNRYASGWSLLRQVTVLSPPSLAPTPPANPPFGLSPNDPALSDSDRQVALMPAASSVMSTLASFEPYDPANPGGGPTDAPLWATDAQLRTRTFPGAASGLIDVATTGLSEVASLARAKTWEIVLSTSPVSVQYLMPSAFRDRQWVPRPAASNATFLEGRRAASVANGGPVFIEADPDYAARTVQSAPMVAASHAWMLDAMPAMSAAVTYQAASINGNSQQIQLRRIPPEARTRPRFEPTPPALLYHLSRPAATNQQRLEKALAVADQTMLMRSVFVPACTEFIVEWSMGESYRNNHPRAGETIWYGLDRLIDENEDGTDDRPNTGYDPSEPRELRGLYPASPFYRFYPAATGGQPDPDDVRERGRLLVHGTEASIGEQIRNGTLHAFFGGAFPLPDPNSGRGEEWPWPKYIRVTMAFVDEREPLREQRYQAVFAIPQE